MNRTDADIVQEFQKVQPEGPATEMDVNFLTPVCLTI